MILVLYSQVSYSVCFSWSCNAAVNIPIFKRDLLQQVPIDFSPFWFKSRQSKTTIYGSTGVFRALPVVFLTFLAFGSLGISSLDTPNWPCHCIADYFFKTELDVKLHHYIPEAVFFHFCNGLCKSILFNHFLLKFKLLHWLTACHSKESNHTCLFVQTVALVKKTGLVPSLSKLWSLKVTK